MKAVIQRVFSASVIIDGKEIGSINQGLLVLLGVSQEDAQTDLEYLVKKTAGLRIFKDKHANMNLTIKDVGGEALVVSQFTLYAETRRGRRPSFSPAAPAQSARELFDKTLELFKVSGLSVTSGRFQEHMIIELQNNGPVTILIDSSDRWAPTRGR